MSEQLIMRPLFTNFPLLHDVDLVRMANCAQPMGNYDNRPPLTHSAHIYLHNALCFEVQRACCLIENQNPWICYKSTGNRNALALSEVARFV